MANLHSITPEDFGTIIQMLRFFREESPEYNYTADDGEYVTANLKAMHDSGMLFGVIEDGRGFMLGAMSRSWYSSRLDASELVLFVYPPYRGSSLAVRLIKQFEQEARAKGAHTLGVGVSTGIREEQTARMYERLGYVPKGHSLSKVLCATQSPL